MFYLNIFLYLFICLLCPQFSRAAGGSACVKSKEAIVKPASKEIAANRLKKNRTISGKIESELKLVKYTPLYWSGDKEGSLYKMNDYRGRLWLVKRRDISFRMRCIAVNVEKSRLRKGPGSNFERAFLAQKGDAFLDLGSTDGWIQVMDAKGESAWLNLDHSWRPTSKMRMKFEAERIGVNQQ